jgi:hypothetical protein
MVAPLPPELVVGDAMELIVDQRQESIDYFRVAAR